MLAAILMVTLTAGCPGGGETAKGAKESIPLRVPADYMAVAATGGFARFGGGKTLDPAEAALIGPYSRLAFDGVATATEATAAQVEALRLVDPKTHQGLLPADGFEFLVLHTAKPSQSGAAGVSILAGTTLSLRTGGETRKVDRSLPAEKTILLSVRRDAEATLLLDEQGRVQSLDLRAGRRGADAIALYYQPRGGGVSGQLSAWGQVGGVTVPSAVQGNLVPIGGDIRGAALLPFRAGNGWAKPGRLWLQLTLHGWQILNANTQLTLDVAASFTLTEPGGKPVRALPGDIKITLAVAGLQDSPVQEVVFEVPEAFRSGVVNFAPQGSVKVQDKTGTLRSRTAAKPVTIDIP